MDDQLLKVFSRINSSSDGIEFIEFLKQLSLNNYNAFKSAPTEYNDIHKGQAIAIDELIGLFYTADAKLNAQNKAEDVIINPV